MALFSEREVEKRLCELIFERFPGKAIQLYQTWEAIKPKMSGNSSQLDVPIPSATNWTDADVLRWKGTIACEQILKTRENGVDVPDPIAEHAAKSEKTKLADQIPKEVRNYLADEFGKIPELDTLIAMNIEEAEKLLADQLRRKLESGRFVPPLELSPVEYSPGQPPPFERTLYENDADLEVVAANTPLSLTDCPKVQDSVIVSPTEMGAEAGAPVGAKPSPESMSQPSLESHADFSARLSPSKGKSLYESLIGPSHPLPTSKMLFEERETLDEKLARMIKRFACLSSSSKEGSSVPEDPATAFEIPEVTVPDKEQKKESRVLSKQMDSTLVINGLESEYFSHGEPVHPNAELQIIQQIVRRELTTASNDCTTALLWIRLYLEQLEDKTSKYYQQFLLLVSVLERKRDEITDIMNRLTDFHQERAKLAEDIVKYPHIEDYRLALSSFDEREYATDLGCLVDLADFYLTAFNGVLQEIEP